MSNMEGFGIFIVYAQPKPSQDEKQFNSWYNDEHGPALMRLSWLNNGYRFKAEDKQKPEWLATYDVDDLKNFALPEYKSLLDNQPERETKIVNEGLETLDRRFYKYILHRGSMSHPPDVVELVRLWVDPKDVGEANRFLEFEHVGLLARIPGWQRSRRFELVEPREEGDLVELLSIHEFYDPHGLNGPEWQATQETEWCKKINNEIAKHRSIRSFRLTKVLSAGEGK